MNHDLVLEERLQCLAMSQYLRAASRIGALGLLCIAVALVAALRAPLQGGLGAGLVWAVLALAVVERVLALRVNLDARLFESLANGDLPSLRRLDETLVDIGLVAPIEASAPTRDLPSRLAGTRRLTAMHAVSVAALALLAGVLLTKALA